MTLQVQLLRDSFELAKPIADQISQKFYELLFQDYPQAQGLFQQVDMEKQQKALIRSLVFIVDNLEKAAEFYEKEMGLEVIPAFLFDYPTAFFKIT